jgi:hypothetical protein
MTMTLTQAVRALEAQSNEDPDLAEVLVMLAEGPEGPADPFAPAGAGPVAAARLVNARRLAERREAASGATLDTAQVVELVRSLSDRKGVDRRRQRGQLLGWRVGSRTLHPDWQFDRRRGDTRPGLADVLGALAEVTPDAEAADALMRAPREELDGRSLADLLAAGRVETVVRLVRAAADQS